MHFATNTDYCLTIFHRVNLLSLRYVSLELPTQVSTLDLLTNTQVGSFLYPTGEKGTNESKKKGDRQTKNRGNRRYIVQVSLHAHGRGYYTVVVARSRCMSLAFYSMRRAMERHVLVSDDGTRRNMYIKCT